MTVAVLVFDDVPLFLTAVPLTVFTPSPISAAAPAYRVLPVAAGRASARSTAGVRVHAPYGLAALEEADLVIAPSWSDRVRAPGDDVLDAIVSAHDRGATVAGLCMGAFVLGHAGLLDGRRATTHWAVAPAFAELFPSVRVDPRVLYVDDGDVVTSAGSAAAIDCCLHLVRRHAGVAAANAIARRMVVAAHRPGGQAQFVDLPVPQAGSGGELAETLAWAMEHLDEAIGVGDLARHAGLSERSLHRHFVALTGTTPLRWLVSQRMLAARHLLEESDLSVDAVARRVGYANAISLRPHFRSAVGVPPSAYRASFRAG